MPPQKKKVVGRYKSRKEAEARARRLRQQGSEARVRKDPITGEWIVELFVLVIAFGFLGSLLNRSN